MFMYNEWLLAMKESGNSSVKFLQDTTLSCIPSSTIHEYKCSAQIMLLSCNTVLQKSSCTSMLIILTFWHTDIVQSIPNQL